MADAKKEVDPGQGVEGEEAVEDVAVSSLTPNKQSQKPVDSAAVELHRLEVEPNAVSLAQRSRPADFVSFFSRS